MSFDANIQQPSDASAIQSSTKNPQNVQVEAQDAVKAAADPTAWTKSPQEMTVSQVDTTGKSNLYQDSSLPAVLSGVTSAQSGDNSLTVQQQAGSPEATAIKTSQTAGTAPASDLATATLSNFTSSQLPTFEQDAKYLGQDITNLTADLKECFQATLIHPLLLLWIGN